MPNQTTSKPQLILIDGSSFLYRAFHAVPPMKSPKGVPVHAVYGVTSMLRKLMTSYPVDHICVVFDEQGKNFRHELYDLYKANRPTMPEDLQVQVEPLRNLVRTMGLPLIAESGVEADDVLGALAQYAEQQGYQVIIATGDKDMAQLVTENITLENTMTNTKMNIQGVIDKFGVRPEKIIDYLALMGDTSDNIPGVPKVGPKTAAKWLDQYGNLENLISHANEIKGKIGENLQASLDYLPLSKKLTTIRCDLDLPYGMSDLKRSAVDNNKLRDLAVELGFPISQLNYVPA